jgi:flavin-dependent dehydrogenase
MVRRDDFDHAWYQAAVRAGATVRQHAAVRAIAQHDHTATVTLADGTEIAAGVVIGADGSAAVSSRHVGVIFDQQDLGLEVELAATEHDRSRWRGRVLLDWGPVPGSYGWVFPKMKGCKPHGAACRSAGCWSTDDELTVGVIMTKGHGAATKQYLHDFVARLGLADRKTVRDSGHLTRCRRPGSPLRKGRVIVTGDAAGLLEPWTREGISFALRSGTWAGEAAAAGDLAAYERRVAAELAPEMAAGRRLLAVFAKHPLLVHSAMATPLGWRAFEQFCRGELAMARVIDRAGIRTMVKLLGA